MAIRKNTLTLAVSSIIAACAIPSYASNAIGLSYSADGEFCGPFPAFNNLPIDDGFVKFAA